jgi:mRNA interferase MazF
MAGFVKGEDVVIPFPFSDLSGSKKRPALVLANLDGDVILLCQITSQQSRHKQTVPLLKNDFLNGSLPVSSFVRPLRIFTADKAIIQRRVGIAKPEIMLQVIEMIVKELNK